MLRFVSAGVRVCCLTVLLCAAWASPPALAGQRHSAEVKKHASRAKTTIRATRRVTIRAAHIEPARPSFGQLAGLHATLDPLALKSSVALVLDQDTHEVLLSKNSQAVLPIASITKLMSAVIVTEAKQPLEQVLTITQDDVDTEKNSRSRLAVGTSHPIGDHAHDSRHRNPQTANARSSAHLPRVDGDSREFHAIVPKVQFQTVSSRT